MAIKRVSDLPSLHGTYEDAQLSSCLVEVSCLSSDHLKFSFNLTLDDIANMIRNEAQRKIANN